MKMKHKNKDEIIQVTSRRGKPVPDKAGWVKLEKEYIGIVNG